MSGGPAVGAVTAAIDLEHLDIGSFRDRPVVILGLARSGVALCRFLHDQGARVTVYDGRAEGSLGEAIDALEGRAIRRLLGPEVDPAEAVAGQAMVITSPSISSRYPTTEPRLRAVLGALESTGGVPVVSEVDLFLRLCPATTVGVTGTKGKTTTSSLAAAVLERGAAPVLLGGNIGRPLVEHLPKLTAGHRVVLELSELQLPTLSRGTDVAVYTHVTQDHLDRHGTVEAYRAQKRRLAELAPAGGRLVLNAEDPVSAAYASLGRVGSVLYRRSAPIPGGVGVVNGWVVGDDVERLPGEGGGPAATGPEGRVLPLAEIPLPGRHNVSNVLAAVGVGLVFGVAPDAIREAVSGFRGVEHRLQVLGEIGGIRYVNDSQGTQPDAVIAALQSFDAPIVLIAGGRDKGSPLEELAATAVDRAEAVVLMGESAPLLERALRAAGHSAVHRASSMEEAVRLAARLAHRAAGPSGATVLLSPAAASFDMFPDYAARGRAFAAAVRALATDEKTIHG